MNITFHKVVEYFSPCAWLVGIPWGLFCPQMSQKFFGSDRSDLPFALQKGKRVKWKTMSMPLCLENRSPKPIQSDPIRYDTIAAVGGSCGGADADADVDRSGAECCGSGLVIGAHIGKREHFIFKRFKNTIIIEFAA